MSLKRRFGLKEGISDSSRIFIRKTHNRLFQNPLSFNKKQIIDLLNMLRSAIEYKKKRYEYYKTYGYSSYENLSTRLGWSFSYSASNKNSNSNKTKFNNKKYKSKTEDGKNDKSKKASLSKINNDGKFNNIKSFIYKKTDGIENNDLIRLIDKKDAIKNAERVKNYSKINISITIRNPLKNILKNIKRIKNRVKETLMYKVGELSKSLKPEKLSLNKVITSNVDMTNKKISTKKDNLTIDKKTRVEKDIYNKELGRGHRIEIDETNDKNEKWIELIDINSVDIEGGLPTLIEIVEKKEIPIEINDNFGMHFFWFKHIPNHDEVQQFKLRRMI